MVFYLIHMTVAITGLDFVAGTLFILEVAADNRLSAAILDQKRLLKTGCH